MRQELLFCLSAFTLATLVATSPGCGDSCEDLVEICDRCTDRTARDSCNATVDSNVQDVCSTRKGEYETQCPFPLPTTTTTTSGGAFPPVGGGGAGGDGGAGGGAAGDGGNGGNGGSGGAPGGGGAGG